MAASSTSSATITWSNTNPYGPYQPWQQGSPSGYTINIPTTESAPKLPIVLDASEMVTALEAYREFLEDVVDGLEPEDAARVEDALFGLRETLDALKQLGQD